MKEKECTKCRQNKIHDEFCRNSTQKDMKHYYCKDCMKEKKLQRRFGINIFQYNDMLLKQKNKCAICGCLDSQTRRCLDVDHDHKTGKIRGLLCYNCNLAVGNVKESIEICKKLIEYLIKYSGENNEEN